MEQVDRRRLLDYLQREGVVDLRGVGHKPRMGYCHRCGVRALGAIDDIGFSVVCWPLPTTPLGEWQAISAGLRTYTWRYDQALYYRYDFRIRGNNANDVPVVIEHQCHHSHPPISEIHNPFKKYEPLPERPPF